jgi:hypothetical protein
MSHNIIRPLCHSEFMLEIYCILHELKDLETIPFVLYFNINFCLHLKSR